MKEDRKYTHGFKAPAAYFDKLEEALEIRLAEDTLPTEHGMRVPDGYFDTLEDRLLEQVQEAQKQNEPKVRKLWPQQWQYAAAIAASLIIGFLLFMPKENPSLEELPLAEVEHFIQNDGLEIHLQDVAQLFNDSELQELSIGLQFEENQLETYLMEHIDETTLLLE